MRFCVTALIILGCIYYCSARSIVIQEDACPEGQIRIEGKCSDRTRNVIQVPGKCPPGQDVGANDQCFSEFSLPLPGQRIIAPPERKHSGRSMYNISTKKILKINIK